MSTAAGPAATRPPSFAVCSGLVAPIRRLAAWRRQRQGRVEWDGDSVELPNHSKIADYAKAH
jgi:hypothetical protein